MAPEQESSCVEILPLTELMPLMFHCGLAAQAALQTQVPVLAG